MAERQGVTFQRAPPSVLALLGHLLAAEAADGNGRPIIANAVAAQIKVSGATAAATPAAPPAAVVAKPPVHDKDDVSPPEHGENGAAADASSADQPHDKDNGADGTDTPRANHDAADDAVPPAHDKDNAKPLVREEADKKDNGVGATDDTLKPRADDNVPLNAGNKRQKRCKPNDAATLASARAADN